MRSPRSAGTDHGASRIILGNPDYTEAADKKGAARLGESILSIRPRTSELLKQGLLEATGDSLNNVSGQKGHVLRATAVATLEVSP